MMKLSTAIIPVLFFIGLSLGFQSCKKKIFQSTGNLEFSVDTLVFDTVFTTIGSTTQQFKVYNRKNQQLNIEEIELMGGTSSPFRINFDGLQGVSFTDQTIEGGDSLFCFVEVTLGINGQNLPLVVEDSIRFRTNGKDQYVKLAVWGQDMYYHYSVISSGIFDLNEGTWPNDKPHVIYGAAIVDSAKTLNILGGTNIYMHKNSILFNYKGTLNIDGDFNNKVVIQGDRLESLYDDVPGQYYGVYYQEARPSYVDNVLIKNATAGIHVFSRDMAFDPQTTVKITNSEIKNCASYGLFLFASPKVEAENLLIHSSGVHALLILQGADYRFTHCNFLGYGGGEGSAPAVGIRNYYIDQFGNGTIAAYCGGSFNNCVIYGSDNDQIAIDTLVEVGATIDLNFNNSVIKSSLLNNPMFASCNQNNPIFNAPFSDNFKFSATNSSLNNTANFSYQNTLPQSVGIDFFGMGRGNPADIGVFEGP